MSEWGRKEVEGFYDDVASELGGPEASELSSAISPRDTRPRTKPFDMEEATQVGRGLEQQVCDSSRIKLCSATDLPEIHRMPVCQLTLPSQPDWQQLC